MSETKNNVSGYIDYFRQIAIAHQEIKHDPVSETDSDAPVGSKHFTKISVDEVVGGLRTTVGWPCLTLELYETQTKSETPLDIRRDPRGAFMILVNPVNDTFPEQENCYINAEAIVIDILKQIWFDHYAPGNYGCKTPFREFNFDKLDIIPVGPIFNGQHGYRVEFDFEFQQDIDLTEPPAEGTFIFSPDVLVNYDNAPLENNDDSDILLQ